MIRLESHPALPPSRLEEYRCLLTACGLTDEGDGDQTVLAVEEETGRLAACGTRRGDLLLQIAVDPGFRGEDLAARVLSALMAQVPGRPWMLCTKPEHRRMFASLGFSPLVETADALLMEHRRGTMARFLSALPRFPGENGAVVCHCDPFTLGHRHLIEYAAGRCGHLYVLVLSEDRGAVPAADRLRLVAEGTADLPNVTVAAGGPYFVSRATFPAYFVKDRSRVEAVRTDLDLALFGRQAAPALGIVRRFVGEEPYCPVTAAYNENMRRLLPAMGVAVEEIPRLGGISAGAVRRLWAQGNWEEVRSMVPETTYAWLRSHTPTGP